MNTTSWNTYLQSLSGDDRTLAEAALAGKYCPSCGEHGIAESTYPDGFPLSHDVSCRKCPFDTRYPETWPAHVRSGPLDPDIHRLIGENGQ